MDALRLIELIKSPEAIKAADLDDLKNLVTTYPYFGIGHILLLNGLKRFDADKFENQVNKSAVRIADRTVIYQMVKKAKGPVSVATVSYNITPVALEEPVQVQEIQPIEPVADSRPTEPIIAELPVDSETVIVEPTPTLVEEKERVTISLDEIFGGVDEELDEHELFHAENVPATQTIPEEYVDADTLAEEHEEPFTTNYNTMADDGEPIVEQPKPSNKMNLGSFNSWLKQQLNEKNKVGVQKSRPDEKEIIEKFIQAEPKISKPKAEFFNPIEVSKRSVVDNESIVSETLAKVYADQGDYDKAISAYKKLSLQNPEKSTYFAALIYELELKQSLE